MLAALACALAAMVSPAVPRRSALCAAATIVLPCTVPALTPLRASAAPSKEVLALTSSCSSTERVSSSCTVALKQRHTQGLKRDSPLHPSLHLSLHPPQARVQLEETLAVLEKVIVRWDDLVVQCNYAEVDRSLLESGNKEQLLAKASVKGAYQKDSSVVKNTCKTSGRTVGEFFSGPLKRAGPLLQQPRLVQQVDPDELDSFIAASERFESAAAAASAAAYASGSGDFSSNTGFALKQSDGGEGPGSGASRNLDAARGYATDARDALKDIIALLSAESMNE